MRNTSVRLSARLRALMIAPVLTLVLHGCGGAEQKTGEVVPVPQQQVDANKNMEEFMKNQGAKK